MNVLLIHNYYQNPGGEDKVFKNEYNLLKSNNVNVSKFIVNNNEIELNNKFMVGINSIWSFYYYKKLSKILKSNNYHIVHVHNTHAKLSPSIYYACKNYGIPVILTLHNYRICCPKATLFRKNNVCELCVKRHFPYHGIYYKCYHNSILHSIILSLSIAFHKKIGTYRQTINHYIALTNFSRNIFVKAGIPRKKISVKPNFIVSDSSFSKRNKKYFLFIGRITKEKGIKTLLRTWALNKDYPLKIVGDGDLKEYVKHEIKQKSLKNVEYIGHISSEDTIIKLLRNSYCLIVPSLWYEGFPMTIVESFNTGTPVIASNIGSLSEIVQHKNNGLLFMPDDAHDLSLKVKWAWNNENYINLYSINARKEYEKKYTSQENFNQLMAIYNKVIFN